MKESTLSAFNSHWLIFRDFNYIEGTWRPSLDRVTFKSRGGGGGQYPIVGSHLKPCKICD